MTVSGNLATKLGAVAIDDEVWISNPVTGDFETLPAGYDIDPSRFFDPKAGGSRSSRTSTTSNSSSIDDRGGERYHVRGVADADDVRNITVGLVRDQDVAVDLWVHPSTVPRHRGRVRTTVIDGARRHTGCSNSATTATTSRSNRPRTCVASAATTADRERPSTTGRRRPSPAAILAVVGFSVFVAADDLTVVSTMLRPIIGDLGLVLPDGLDDAAWIVNAYLIAFVAIMPIAGRISDVIGRRRTFVGAYLAVPRRLDPDPAVDVSFDHAFGWFLAGRVTDRDRRWGDGAGRARGRR